MFIDHKVIFSVGRFLADLKEMFYILRVLDVFVVVCLCRVKKIPSFVQMFIYIHRNGRKFGFIRTACALAPPSLYLEEEPAPLCP